MTAALTHHIDIQRATLADTPSDNELISWAVCALADLDAPHEMTLRLVDEAEIRELNHTYRNKSYATNVLSFPAEVPDEVDIDLLGDVIICAQVVAQEAAEQGKSISAHWAHMVIHGVLHLRGYDHIDDIEADEMEAFEIELLAQLNFPNPYSDGDH